MQKDFCYSCCNKAVDSTNPVHKFLCEKQCSTIEEGISDTKSWQSCLNPSQPEKSVYPYCDEMFKNDFYQNTKCKNDMCNLCCVSVDTKGRHSLTDLSLNECYTQCAKSKII